MKKIILILGLGIAIHSCNSASDTKTDTDTVMHNDAMPDTIGNMHQKDSVMDPMRSMHDAMSNMMNQVHNWKPSGSTDQDFAMLMKIHHEGALHMANAEVSGGKDAEMIKIADRIIATQKSEVEKFDILQQTALAAGNSDFGKKAMSMMRDMNSIQMESSSLDAMFASMMIPHHEDGIKMAKEYLKVGNNPELKKMATNIVENQSKEISQLKDWLNKNK